MTNSLEPIPTSALPIAAEPKAGVIARIIAFVAALCVLIVGGVLSIGAVLLAPAVMAISGHVWRRRGRVLSAGGRWVAATCSAAIVLLLLAGLGAAMVPAGTWQQVKQATDSAQVASAHRPPPAWVERIYPGMSRRAAQAPPPSPSVMTTMMAFGAAFALIFFSAFFGTIGWGGGMLLGLAINGRWPGAPAA